jgi:hypothetical protein
MGRACSTYGEEERYVQGWGILRKRNQSGEPGVDMRINLRWIFRKWCVAVDWIYLAQDRNR